MKEPKNIKFIVEVASNHEGNFSLAKEFIKVASEAGADYDKFQSYRYEDLIDKKDAHEAWIKKTALSDEEHIHLINECRRHNIQFLTTCFSIQRIKFLASLGLKEVKVASPDLLSFSMLEKLAESFEHIIISTGMHSIKDIRKAIAFLIKNNINATLLHTVSLYPVPIEKSFMYKFLWLKDNYSKVGYSNHVSSIEPIKFAMANGAEIIEAHMKLGDSGPGRVTAWDISSKEFVDIIEYRDTLNKILGDPKWLGKEDFLFTEEFGAQKRFIGRWGDNR